jgi:phospholipase/lecithinase/hemolysin
MIPTQEIETMTQPISRSVRPALEGLEGRQLLSATWYGHAVPRPAAETSHAIPLTSIERGTYTVRVERTSPLQEQFRFLGQGTIDGIGPVQLSGSVTVKENLSQAGEATGVLRLTLPGGMGTARVLVSQTIPAHTGSIGALPFHYTFSGGTGLFRRGFDSGTGTLVRTSANAGQRVVSGGFTVFVFSNHYTGLVAFGDSLTDIGNRFAATDGTEPASPPYDAGRWSDGPLWIEHLASGLGLPAPTPSALGGTDYAAADAGTALSGYAHNGSPSIGTQIAAYLSTHPSIDSDQLFIIWGGTSAFGPHSTPDPAGTVANLTAEITELARAGAEQFLVPNLMPLGEVPGIRQLGPQAEAKYDALSVQFNTELTAAENQLEEALGVKIHRLDAYGLVEQVIANPTAFGITDVIDQAKSGNEGDPGVVVPNRDQYLFWDNIHPGETFEELLGKQAMQAATQ